MFTLWLLIFSSGVVRGGGGPPTHTSRLPRAGFPRSEALILARTPQTFAWSGTAQPVVVSPNIVWRRLRLHSCVRFHLPGSVRYGPGLTASRCTPYRGRSAQSHRGEPDTTLVFALSPTATSDRAEARCFKARRQLGLHVP